MESALGLHYYAQNLDSGLILVRYILKLLQANHGDPDQTPLTVASALGLHYLPTSKTWPLGLYFCKQIMKTLVRRRQMRRPLWVYIVCQRG